jgi:hypothetical protein
VGRDWGVFVAVIGVGLGGAGLGLWGGLGFGGGRDDCVVGGRGSLGGLVEEFGVV